MFLETEIQVPMIAFLNSVNPSQIIRVLEFHDKDSDMMYVCMYVGNHVEDSIGFDLEGAVFTRFP